MAGTRILARVFSEKNSGVKNSGGGTRKNYFAYPGTQNNFFAYPPKISENFSLFGSKKFFVNRLPKGNFRGYAYPPKSSQASRWPKSRHPLLGGYAQKLFCVPRYAKTFSRTRYAHLGGTFVPLHRVDGSGIVQNGGQNSSLGGRVIFP